METRKKIEGLKEYPKQLSIYNGTIYVRTNIKELSSELVEQLNIGFTEDEINEMTFYEFQETQYEINEYIELMALENGQLINQITDLQLALAEIYEGSI